MLSESRAAGIFLVPEFRSPMAEYLAAVRHYYREHLAAYKCPQRWEFLDQFPLTPSGKIQKFKLRERLGAGAEGRAAAPALRQ